MRELCVLGSGVQGNVALWVMDLNVYEVILKMYIATHLCDIVQVINSNTDGFFLVSCNLPGVVRGGEGWARCDEVGKPSPG